jgi:hypothetical protein
MFQVVIWLITKKFYKIHFKIFMIQEKNNPKIQALIYYQKLIKKLRKK